MGFCSQGSYRLHIPTDNVPAVSPSITVRNCPELSLKVLCQFSAFSLVLSTCYLLLWITLDHIMLLVGSIHTSVLSFNPRFPRYSEPFSSCWPKYRHRTNERWLNARGFLAHYRLTRELHAHERYFDSTSRFPGLSLPGKHMVSGHHLIQGKT